jgi:hypothetical protein
VMCMLNFPQARVARHGPVFYWALSYPIRATADNAATVAASGG